MIDRLARILFRVRYVVWLVVLPLTVVSWMLVPPVEFDQTIEGFFPPDHPALLSYERSKRAFGGDQIVFVAYDDPELWTEAGMDFADALHLALSGKAERVATFDEALVKQAHKAGALPVVEAR